MGTPDRQTERVRFLTDIAFWAVILAIVYFCFTFLVNLIMPFFIALLFAAISRPLARILSRKTKTKRLPDGTVTEVPRRFTMSHNVAGVLSVVALYLLFVGIAALIVLRIIETGDELISALPGFYNNTVLPVLNDAMNTVTSWAGRVDASVLELVQSSAPNILSTIGTKVTDISAKLVVWVSSLAGSLPSILMNTLICLIATVFIAVDFEDISSFLGTNLPGRAWKIMGDVKESFVQIVWQFLKSYFFIFLITVSEITVGLLIVGQSRPVLIAILVAVFDAFPIVGSGMILLPWAVITLLSGAVGKGIGLLIVYLVVVIARQIIEPRIVGKHVGLRPIVTLLCMYVGTRLFGALGLFGLPITAAILVDMNESGAIQFFKKIPKADT